MPINCFLIVILSTVFALPSSVNAHVNCGAALSGQNAVPPSPTNGIGYAIFTLIQPSNMVVYRIAVGQFQAITLAHIHAGLPGSNGPIMYTLDHSSLTGVFGPISQADVMALYQGGWYCDLHNANGWQLRGQIRPEITEPLRCVLTGDDVFPPVPTTARGFASAILSIPSNILLYSLTTTHLVGPLSAHLHNGIPGTVGPIVLPLNGGPTVWSGASAVLTDGQVSDILQGRCYLDIHTLAFPAGEIRGQVGGAGYHAIASLDGQQAVPRSNSPATGQALFSTVGSSFIEYQLQTNAMSGTEAHVHIAPPGQVGSTAFALNGAPPTYSGVQMVSTDILQLLRQRLLYVDVHSQSIPLGEIRGQIGQNPSIYGFSTTAANGNVPHAMWFTTERPIIGYSFELLLVGGSPSANAFLLLSFGPAAIPLLQFGLGPSWLWVDPTIMVLFHVASDPAGLGRFRISIPPVEGLIGVSVYAQWIVEAPNTTPLGYITSDALKATIQTLRN